MAVGSDGDQRLECVCRLENNWKSLPKCGLGRQPSHRLYAVTYFHRRGEYMVPWGPICNIALVSHSPWPSPHSTCVSGFRKAVREEMAYFIKGDWNSGCVLVSCLQAEQGRSHCLQLEGKYQWEGNNLWAGGPCSPPVQKFQLKMEFTTTRRARLQSSGGEEILGDSSAHLHGWAYSSCSSFQQCPHICCFFSRGWRCFQIYLSAHACCLSKLWQSNNVFLSILRVLRCKIEGF